MNRLSRTTLTLKFAFLLAAAGLSPAVLAQDSKECIEPPLRSAGPTVPGKDMDPDSYLLLNLNIHGELDWKRVADTLARMDPARNADLLTLQEVQQDASGFLQQASEALGYHYVFAANEDCGENCEKGIAILSRLELLSPRVLKLPRFDLGYHNRCRIAISAEVQSPVGKLAVVNLHLDTRINSKRRVAQLAPVLELVGEVSDPVIVSGDFNTADIKWVKNMLPLPGFSKQTKAVLKAMEAAGFSTPFRGTGPTFNKMRLKLDWIFLRGLEIGEEDRGILPIDFSDHKALWVRLH